MESLSQVAEFKTSPELVEKLYQFSIVKQYKASTAEH